MNSVLHRISHEAKVSYPLLENGCLTIGWSDFGNQQFIDNTLKGSSWEERWKNFQNQLYPNARKSRNRHSLWRFVEGFKKGFYVVVPLFGGRFSVYEIISDQVEPISNLTTVDLKGNSAILNNGNLYDNGRLIDLGFFWRVKPIIKNASRHSYADAALTKRMKIRNTNSFINHLSQNIEKAIFAFNKKTPINIYDEILKVSIPPILNTLKQELNPDKLEKLIQWYFNKIGANSVDIPAKNERDKEGDADIVAIFESIKTIIYIQAKFHEGQTDAFPVSQIKEYSQYKDEDDSFNEYTHISWVISTCDSFSDDCITAAQEEKVRLISGEDFAKMLLEVGISNLDQVL